MAKRLGIYIYNGAEVIDWAGPVGVFAVARRMDPELNVFLVGDSLTPVMATGNLKVEPRYSLDQHPDTGIPQGPCVAGGLEGLGGQRLSHGSQRSGLITASYPH